MKSTKKMLLAVLCVTLALLFAGCSYVTVNEERDNAQVVAEVNGTPIYKKAYYEIAPTILGNYGETLETVEEAEDPDLYKDEVLKSLVEQELLYQISVEEGVADTSQENIDSIIASNQEWVDSRYWDYLEQAEADGVDNPEEVALKDWNDYIVLAGYSDMEALAMQSIRSTALNDMYDKIIGEVTYTEEQAKEYYDEQVGMQKDLVEQDPENYMMYKMFGTAYVNPANSRYVKNLLIAIPEEAQNEIAGLRAAGEDAEADQLLQEELAKIQDAAEAALERVESGEDFDEVMAEIGEDPGMRVDPEKTYGYLVIEGGTDYVQEFQDAAMALSSEGETTGLVATDFGYHILQYVKDGAGPVDFEMMKDDIISQQQSSAESTKYREYMDAAKEEAEIKTYINRV